MAPIILKPRYISGAEFHRFCVAKDLNASCLRCGEGRWELHDTARQLGMVGQHNGIDGVAADTQTPLLTLSCSNCGTLWTLVRGGVQQWLDENPEAAADE